MNNALPGRANLIGAALGHFAEIDRFSEKPKKKVGLICRIRHFLLMRPIQVSRKNEEN